MTAQFDDLFRYHRGDYSVAGISAGELFDPALLDLKPQGTCSACWRGYVATFGVAKRRLVLQALDVNLLNPQTFDVTEGPAINGVSPVVDHTESKLFNNSYSRLDYHLEYSGGLLLAQGFIRELYVHMGFHPPWKYERVIELTFEGGILQQEFDRSERMAEIREMICHRTNEETAGDLPDDADLRTFIERAFDRSYKL